MDTLKVSLIQYFGGTKEVMINNILYLGREFMANNI